MWNGLKVWGAGPWEFEDANDYITDNMESIRRYQTMVRSYSASIVGVSTPAVIGAVVTNLCDTTPDEPTRTTLIVAFYANSASTNTQAGCAIYKESFTAPNALGVVYNSIASGGGTASGCVIGSWESDAGVNPSFVVAGATTGGTINMSYTATAIVAPIT